MSELCKWLKMLIEDEGDAQSKYEKLKQHLDNSNRWKVEQIQRDEKTHYEELHEIAKRQKCSF